VGGPLRLDVYKHWLEIRLLKFALPAVTTLQVSRGGDYELKAPMEGWREMLRASHDYVMVANEAPAWESFAQFTGDIRDVLFYRYPHCQSLNSRFAQRVNDAFLLDELEPLIKGLYRVCEGRQYGRQVPISPRELALLQRAQRAFGELDVAYNVGGRLRSERFDTIDLPEPDTT